MAENSEISWTDHTFNPWEGCQKVGPGCDNCYAEARNSRFGGGTAINWGPGAPRRRTSGSNWNKPSKWNAAHEAFFAQHGRRQRVFCASLADVFDNEVDPAWRAELFALIDQTPNLDWLLLTKRIGNVAKMIETPGMQKCGLPANVWLGATIVNQEEADRDIPKLLALPAPVRFLSMEPLLGRVMLPEVFLRPLRMDGRECAYPDGCGLIDWVIVGGESGPGARPMHPDWARSLRDQCAAAGVAFHFKQFGEWAPVPYSEVRRGWNPTSGREHLFQDGPEDQHTLMEKVGKKAAGRLLDGATHDAFPEVR